MRVLTFAIIYSLYRLRYRHLERIPKKGPVILVCNHVSYMDALLIAGACRRPVRFVINASIYQIYPLTCIFRAVRAIPVPVEKPSPKSLQKALQAISSVLDKGGVICVFPEGHLTRNGQVDRFFPGITRIVARNPAPVVPMAISGLWGSFFTHANGEAMKRFPRPFRFRPQVELVVGRPVMPDQVTPDRLREKVMALKRKRTDNKKSGWG
ncbi:1-acyl-sn-glycerol-3-phosphate acyltransferase [Desulfosarcina sp. OttesenSCG-928-G17]|nr:1-acyl-sn-glycerol-3-phosphate acyltransferase [Desulfosarcina sp. OttesenSCG-928-G17]